MSVLSSGFASGLSYSPPSIAASGGNASAPFNASATIASGPSSIAVQAAAGGLVLAALILVGFYYWTRTHQL